MSAISAAATLGPPAATGPASAGGDLPPTSEAPEIHGVSPSTAERGASFTVTATGFRGGAQLYVGTRAIASSCDCEGSPQVFHAIVPRDLAPRAYDVSLVAPGGARASQWNALTVAGAPAAPAPGGSGFVAGTSVAVPPRAPDPAPSIDRLAPEDPRAGESFTIHGRDFHHGLAVLVGGERVEASCRVPRCAEGRILVSLPLAFPQGLHEVIVLNPDGQRGEAPTRLTVREPFVPDLVVVAVTPERDPAIPNERVIVRVTLLNAGIAPSGDVTFALHARAARTAQETSISPADGASGSARAGTYRVAEGVTRTLDPGETRTLEVAWFTREILGEVELEARAAAAAPEVALENNAKRTAVRVVAPLPGVGVSAAGRALASAAGGVGTVRFATMLDAEYEPLAQGRYAYHAEVEADRSRLVRQSGEDEIPRNPSRLLVVRDAHAGPDADGDGFPERVTVVFGELSVDSRTGEHEVTPRPDMDQAFTIDPDDGDANAPLQSWVNFTAVWEVAFGEDADGDAVPSVLTVTLADYSFDRRTGTLTTSVHASPAHVVTIDPDDADPNNPAPSAIEVEHAIGPGPGGLVFDPDEDGDGIPSQVRLPERTRTLRVTVDRSTSPATYAIDVEESDGTEETPFLSVPLDPNDADAGHPVPEVAPAEGL